AGHTDTVGSDKSNVTLSRIRADAAHGLLVGDRTEFATACWGPHLTEDQRYPNGGDGSKKGVLWDDYSDVLTWAAKSFGWPCEHPHGTRTLWQATKNFEVSYNASDVGAASAKPLATNGHFTKATWGAMYDCYERKLAEALNTDLAGLAQIRGKVTFVNPAVHEVSCGEYKPIDQLGRDNYRSQTNRRVEILFFDPGEEPNPPCFSGTCIPSQCDIYDNRIYKPQPVPLPPVGTGHRLRIRMAHAGVDLPGHAYEIWSNDVLVASGTTGAGGLIDEPLPGDLDTAEVRLPDLHFAELFKLQGAADFPPAIEVKGAQVRLRQIGYYVGPVDGQKEEVTDDAIRNFKVDHGLADNSTLDGDTAAALTKAYGS
ncbi:MAG TPA: peptidoglycan-binding protein, partial [Mycobacterium sp.]|nr:peptidoglycan-binding protein [Mycobacterium sp.]